MKASGTDSGQAVLCEDTAPGRSMAEEWGTLAHVCILQVNRVSQADHLYPKIKRRSWGEYASPGWECLAHTTA